VKVKEFIISRLRSAAKGVLPAIPFAAAVALGEALEPLRDRLLETPFQTEYYGAFAVAFLVIWFADSVQAKARYLSHGRLIHPAQVLASGAIGGGAYVVGMEPMGALALAIISDFIFQLSVNSAFPGRRLIEPSEEAYYTFSFRGKTHLIPKLFSGRMRYAQLPVGILIYLAAYHPALTLTVSFGFFTVTI
jgi:hypothetical protein